MFVSDGLEDCFNIPDVNPTTCCGFHRKDDIIFVYPGLTIDGVRGQYTVVS